MNQDTVQQIDANIRELREVMELNAVLERLKANQDFKKLVLQGYFKDEAVRLVHLKADPSMQTPERQESIDKAIDSIGHLSGYFATVKHSALIAAKGIEHNEAMREEILTGDDE